MIVEYFPSVEIGNENRVEYTQYTIHSQWKEDKKTVDMVLAKTENRVELNINRGILE